MNNKGHDKVLNSCWLSEENLIWYIMDPLSGESKAEMKEEYDRERWN